MGKLDVVAFYILYKAVITTKYLCLYGRTNDKIGLHERMLEVLVTTQSIHDNRNRTSDEVMKAEGSIL